MSGVGLTMNKSPLNIVGSKVIFIYKERNKNYV